MKGFFLWFLQRWVLSLLAVIILSVLVWIEGPLFAYDSRAPLEDTGARWWVILFLFAAWALFWIARMVMEKLNGMRLARLVAGEAAAKESDAPPDPNAADISAELSALALRLQEALQVLRSAHHRGSGQVLYRLPWYMIIGAPGSGKTTALAQSGLPFPLAATSGRPAFAGIGGTRNCDWWLSEDAVLIDTAGRYTSQDSHAEVDQAAWLGFLQMLRRQRKRQPINGVILAISVADLLQKDSAARHAQALAMRARIKELHEQLGIRFPVYVMITKCDLLAGFMEFFDSYSREDRTQPWGVTFPLDEARHVDRALASLAEEFSALERVLQGRLLERMQQERDMQRRALIYGFPQQFAGLAEPLEGMLQDVFQSSRFEEATLLRGVYFTSGTQEGSPIDRVIGALATAFGLARDALPALASSGRSYFVLRTLRDVVFREAGLAGTNLRLERRRRLLQVGSLVLLGLFLASVLTVRGISFVRNQALLNRSAEQLAVLEKRTTTTPQSASLAGILPMLDAARSLPTGYAGRNDPVPTLSRIGLYQGARLGSAGIAVYERLLRAALLPRLAGRLEDQLRRGAASRADALHERLRHYLMLCERKRFDPDALQAWFDLDLADALPDASDEQRQRLSGHIAALLGMLAVDTAAAHRVDADLVAATRLELARQPLPQRIYERMKRQMARQGLPEFSVSGAGGQGAALLFVRRSGEPLSRGVPGTYTLAGYRGFVEAADQAIADIAADTWVLGKQDAVTSLDNVDQLRDAVRTLYLADYIRAWDAFLGDISLPPFASLDEGARLAGLMAGAESPLRSLLVAAARETQLDVVRVGAIPVDSVVKAVKNKLDAYRKKLESALGGATPPPPPPARAVNIVDAHFRALHRLAGAGGDAAKGPAPLEAMLLLLKDLSAYFDEAERARRAGTAMPPSDILARLRREAADKPMPLAAILQGLDSTGGGIAQGSDRARLNAAWAPLAAFCQQAIAGRYPLVREAQAEVLPDDFGRFFAPEGMMDDFFQKNLKAHVDMGEPAWRWRPGSAAALGIPEGVLADFQRAAAVRDMFFVAGGKHPSMHFELKPLPLAATIEKAVLDVDGQVMELTAAAAPAAAPFVLPSGKRTGAASLQLTPGGAAALLRAEGPWAWLRLLDLGKLEATAQAERFRLEFALDNRRLQFELIASSVINPFRRAPLEKFQCTGRL